MTIDSVTPSANFTFSGSSFCQNASDPSPIFGSGASAGFFSATPSGLVFVHVNTGQVDLSASAPGTYTITNTIPPSGNCLAASATAILTIINMDDASFVYSSATYCLTGPDPTPAITGLPGGVFSSTPAGLSINPTTGKINLGTSSLGTYTLSYGTNGTCPNTSSITMTITSNTVFAGFSYSGSTFCQNGINPLPVFVPGASAGIFSTNPSGLVFAHVNTGEIDLASSTPGTYTVTNTIPAGGGCAAVIATTIVTINPADDASFIYSSATYCISGTPQTPVITGLPGGVFSSTPVGLSIDPATGTITLSTSAIGVYMLSYTTTGGCPNTSSITMTIDSITPFANFSYSGSSFCQNSFNPLPIFGPGASAGIFSVNPSGLVFVHVNTGEIDLAASVPGTYTVTNTIPISGTCGFVSAIATVTVNGNDDASFVYSSATYCLTGSSQTPLITGLPGGVFSSVPPGLSINPSTGTIDLTTSILGAYTLSYTTNGICPNSSSITMTITSNTVFAGFGYPGSPFCQNTNNPYPTFVAGASAGIFSATPAGLVFVHVNTGQINLSASTAGTYTVINTIPAGGGCAAVIETSTITINPSDNASFTYPSATYCISGTPQTPTITGLPGGTFISSPAGLSINPSTGMITLSTSALGAYILSYITNGACPDTSSIIMTITNANPLANFSYPGSPFCQNTSDPYPLFGSGASAGTYTASPAGLVFVHVNTGQIDLSASAAGTYTVTNTIPISGTCGFVSATSTVVINASPVAIATTSSQNVCTGGTTSIALSSSVSGATYTWTVVQTGVSGATAGTGPSISQTLTGSGSAIYTITPSANGCIGVPTVVTITVSALPVVDTTGVLITPANCGSATGVISGVVMTSGQGPFTYEWKDSLNQTVGTNANLTNVGQGNYSVIVTDSNGCSSVVAGPFVLTATPPVIAAFTLDPITGETPLVVNFTNNSSIEAINYLWEFGTGDTSTAQNPSYTYVPLGNFIVCLTVDNGFGCADSACSTVDIYVNSVVVIPNIFTPNGDGINDVFTVQGAGLKTMDAEIYNRWGQKEFEWHTTNGGWDGRTASGLVVSDGTYFYIIKATGTDGKEYFEKGSFLLTRVK
ncbi:MAG: gliding motility-associated C-terminal domain-containing protein, partial [Bacteroidota bacterium]